MLYGSRADRVSGRNIQRACPTDLPSVMKVKAEELKSYTAGIQIALGSTIGLQINDEVLLLRFSITSSFRPTIFPHPTISFSTATRFAIKGNQLDVLAKSIRRRSGGTSMSGTLIRETWMSSIPAARTTMGFRPCTHRIGPSRRDIPTTLRSAAPRCVHTIDWRFEKLVGSRTMCTTRALSKPLRRQGATPRLPYDASVVDRGRLDQERDEPSGSLRQPAAAGIPGPATAYLEDPRNVRTAFSPSSTDSDGNPR